MARAMPGYADMQGPLAPEESQRIARAFDQCRNSAGFVSRVASKRCLERTNLPEMLQQNIWVLSDKDQDGRLSLREFVCAMHLAEEARRGCKLPVEVRADQQAALVRCVESLVQKLSFSGAAELDHAEAEAGHGDAKRHSAALADGSIEPGAHGHYPLADLMSSMNASLENKKLGQLAQVFEAAAGIASQSDLEKFSMEVLHERKELEQQLARRRVDEQQLREVRSASGTLSEESRQAEADSARRRRRVTLLKDELVFAESECKLAEEDLRELRELDGTARDSAKNKEKLWQMLKSIRELKVAMGEVLQQKSTLQAETEALMERQRHFENDRDLMQAGLEAELTKLSALLAERVRMRAERVALEKETLDHDEELGQESYCNVNALESSPGSRNVVGRQQSQDGGMEAAKATRQPLSVNNREFDSAASPQDFRGSGVSGSPTKPTSPPSSSQPAPRRPYQVGSPADQRGIRHPEGPSGSPVNSVRQSPVPLAVEGK